MSESCCGCIPRRIGILVWGYINAILGILWFSAGVLTFVMKFIHQIEIHFTALGIGIFFISPAFSTIAIMLLLIFEVNKIVTIAAFVALVIFMMVAPFTMMPDDHFEGTTLLEDLLLSLKSILFTMLLIFGCHLKCRILTSLYYYAGLISCAECAAIVTFNIIYAIYAGFDLPSDLSMSEISAFLSTYLCTILLLLINVLLQAYMLFLLRKEINKYKMDERKYVTPTAPSAEDMPLNVQQPEERNMSPKN